jgi:hypothetical protein
MVDARDRATDKAMMRMSAWEADKEREYTKEELEQWFLHEYPEAERRSDGEF